MSSGQRGAKVKALRDQGWERLMDMDAEITRHNQSVEEASWRLPLLQPEARRQVHRSRAPCLERRSREQTAGWQEGKPQVGLMSCAD